jgi:non-heme chloroperoxidase
MFWKVATLAVVLGVSAPMAAFGKPASPDRFVQVAPQVRLRVIDTGDRNARPTLVLVPGWTFTADVWRSEIARFGKDRRVIAIDPRSQGASTKTAAGDTPEQRARDLKVVLERLHVRRFVLVGWSQGVQDVAAFVGAFGTDNIEGVVLVDSTVSSGAGAIAASPKEAAAQFARFDYLQKDPQAYVRGMDGFIIRRAMPKAELDALVRRQLETPPAIGEAMLIADLFGADRTPALKRFDKPTLVIASAFSPELDAQKAMAASLPHGRFEAVENAGHAVFVDQPARFDALLDDFLTRIGA